MSNICLHGSFLPCIILQLNHLTYKWQICKHKNGQKRSVSISQYFRYIWRCVFLYKSIFVGCFLCKVMLLWIAPGVFSLKLQRLKVLLKTHKCVYSVQCTTFWCSFLSHYHPQIHKNKRLKNKKIPKDNH